MELHECEHERRTPNTFILLEKEEKSLHNYYKCFNSFVLSVRYTYYVSILQNKKNCINN